MISNEVMSCIPYIYIAILKPQGLRQSGSSLHLGRGQISKGFELQVIESKLSSETIKHGNIDNL